MISLFQICYSVIGFLYCFALVVYVHFFSGYKIKKSLVTFVYTVYLVFALFLYVTCLIMNWRSIFMITVPLSIAIFAILYVLISKDGVISSLSIVAIQLLPITITFISSLLIAGAVPVKELWHSVVVIVASFVTIAFLIGIPICRMHRVARHFFDDFRRGEVLIAVSFILFDVGVYTYMFVSIINDTFTTGSLVGAFIMCVAAELIVFYNYTLQHKNKEYLEVTLAQENAARALKVWKASFSVIEQASEQSRRYKHDLRHNYLILANMIKAGETQQALDFIAELGISIEEVQIAQYCKNTSVNSILASYIGIAESRNIKTSVRAVVPANLDIDDVELSGIFANALENAIEACEHISSKRTPFITVECDHRHSKLFIHVSNSCRADIVFNDDALPLSNKEGGGRGTLIIKSIVEKHHGMLRFHAASGVFHTQVILNLPRT